jgi:peptidoglycan/xylan/chitin deacetylase (PgdA/CDA1 family)
MKESLFIISLDFELLWGVRDKRTIDSYGANIRGVRQVIPSLLDLFNKYEIHATFATVGFLFARNKEELLASLPAVTPDYSQDKYSPYANNYINKIGNSESDDIYHYGSSLIKLIAQDKKHEIASHTFSHYYCLENASLESFAADLEAAKKIAAVYDIELKSIVFPRNQYSEAHIGICKKMGFTSYRGNETSSIYNPRKNDEQNLRIKFTRLADSYINLTGHHTFSIDIKEQDIVNIPASRFLRPYSSKLKIFDWPRLMRIKKSLDHAAKNRTAFHLWWHPHNFGIHLQENLFFLEEVLKHYKKLHEEYGMESRNMKEIANKLLQPNAVS